MMTENLFQDFEKVSSKQWKQQIQFDLKGADYNETLVWESLEGIKVKPFYHHDEFEPKNTVATSVSTFKILQHIYVQDIEKSNKRASETLQRGAESVYFTLPQSIDVKALFVNLPQKATYFIKPLFVEVAFVNQVFEFASQNQYTIQLLIDPIHQLAKDGNWFTDLNADFTALQEIENSKKGSYLSVDTALYQNAGANIIQQLAYGLSHLNEYYNRIDNLEGEVTLQVSVGANYFFEMAKLRALRMMVEALNEQYQKQVKVTIVANPTKRNKTLYDYNVNMLRTTTECMSAILGGADFVSNLAYDAIFHKENEFGDRIARNQLLVLKNESYFDKVDNPADGAYYIETLTTQLAEKALELFKEIEAAGGFITKLIDGTIQRKIAESAEKEQKLFNEGKEILLGTNKYPNKDDRMKDNLELYPFVKVQPRKTLISPIIEKRLAEKLEQERLNQEEQL